MTTPAGGTVDVTPSQLYGVSGQIASRQDPMNAAVRSLLDSLGSHPDCGGYGTAAQHFASVYKQVAEAFVETWGKTIVSIGGAAVGFTATANHYVTADAASNPTGSPHASPHALPTVIDKAPHFGPVTDLRWNDVDGAQSLLQILHEGAAGIGYTVEQLALDALTRADSLAAILPLPDYQGLSALAEAWSLPAITVGLADSTLTGLLETITDQSDSEWYGAMREFCSAIWGTAAWGRGSAVMPLDPRTGKAPVWADGTAGRVWRHDTAGGSSSHPILSVLTDTCAGINSALFAFAHSAKTVRDKARTIFEQAIDDAMPDLHTGSKLQDLRNAGESLLGIGSNIASGGAVIDVDGDAIDAAVSEYEEAVRSQAADLKKLLPPLKEASLSAPTYAAEEARAESFGARALTDFKKEHSYHVPDDDPANHHYPIDLASEEGLDGAHTLDKHVGKTEGQLAQRLRDQGSHKPTPTWPMGSPKISASSSFATLEEAQKLTQGNIDQNSAVIKQWIDEHQSGSQNAENTKAVVDVVPGGEITGYSITKQSFRNHGMNAQETPTHEVSTVLRWDPDMDPPFVVLTSMPQ
ncbi:RNase A-like domain-containing protein [Streptomyces montanisoli]|uniref:Bacterial CdiA-CT RNAse A domain-containing protein n=1 Tax=Streptomyces montanisoli TaxID=2798581 RepID=A0A940MH68_9ACTN|nr:RNase A-like domain-containing protein [Streptomyces montanisoli]MBP0461149.1 hypothetical protein [Streptomyces montanisoli]